MIRIIKADLKPDLYKNGHFFSGPKELKVKEYSTSNYIISFKPTAMADALAHLTLSNPLTSD